MNQLSGPIPPAIGNLRHLNLLDVSGNMLTGSIPATMANLSACVKMDFSMNKLVGSIPEGLFALDTLEHLSVEGQSISEPNPKASVGMYILKDDAFDALIWNMDTSVV